MTSLAFFETHCFHTSGLDIFRAGPETNTFTFAGLELRCVTIEGQPHFAVQDVCPQIGAYVYDGRVSTTMALAKLDASDKLILPTGEANRIGLKCRGKYGFALITESGLYKLVMRSDKPQAREFQDWVTGTVLPTIRKDGMYLRGEEKLDLTNDGDLARMTEALLGAWRKKAEDGVLTRPVRCLRPD